MAKPVIENHTTQEAYGSSTMTCTYPVGIVAGDFLLTLASSGTTDSRQLNQNAGWNEIFNLPGAVGGIGGSLQGFEKLADGTETGTFGWSVTDAFVRSAVFILRISGAEDPGVSPAVGAGDRQGSGGNAISPDVTATNNDSLSIRMIGARRSGGSITSMQDHVSYATHNDDVVFNWLFEDLNPVPAGPTGTKSVTYTPTWWSSPALAHAAILISPSAEEAGVFRRIGFDGGFDQMGGGYKQ